MLVKDIKKVTSQLNTIWINEDDFSDFYYTVEDIPKEYNDREIEYLTTNSNGEIVIQL